MKKNEVINETENVVMNEEEMQAVIEDNMHFVPKNQLKRFESLSIEEKFKKIQQYQDRAVKIEQWKQTNSVLNRVKEVFEKRNGTIQDAKDVIKWCNEFIESFKEREIERLDAEIAKLQAMKQSL